MVLAREPHQILQGEDQRGFDQTVDHQPVLCGIDFGDARVMPLEAQAVRRDDAVQLVQRREVDRTLRRGGQPFDIAGARHGPRTPKDGRKVERPRRRRDSGAQSWTSVMAGSSAAAGRPPTRPPAIAASPPLPVRQTEARRRPRSTAGGSHVSFLGHRILGTVGRSGGDLHRPVLLQSNDGVAGQVCALDHVPDGRPFGVLRSPTPSRRPRRSRSGSIASPVFSRVMLDIRLPMAVARVDRVAHPADTHHVAALLVVGVGIEKIVGDVLENGLQQRTRPSSSCGRPPGRSSAQALCRSSTVIVLARQQCRAPAEARLTARSPRRAPPAAPDRSGRRTCR